MHLITRVHFDNAFIQVEIAHFNLTILPCQAGFVLTNQSNGLVQCDCSYVDSIWFGSQIISCDKDTQKLRLIVCLELYLMHVFDNMFIRMVSGAFQ